MRNKKNYLSCLVFLGVLVFLGSCTSLKKLNYMQDANSENNNLNKNENKTAAYKNYKLLSKDILYLKVISLDEKMYSLFNSDKNSSNLTSNISVYVNSFSINDSGYVDLPVVGLVKVKGFTIDQAKDLIQKSINEYLTQATIILKLINFNVSILGEVSRPGNFPVYDEKITLFQALGMAGDLTVYGNRKKVMIIRTDSEGPKVNYIDLTDKKIINSEFYYLMPNDVLYVQILPTKPWGFGTAPIGTILSAMTTFILIFNYLK